ncbi:MAG: hypothetical protein ABTQ73_07890 [Caldilineales bacterium]
MVTNPTSVASTQLIVFLENGGQVGGVVLPPLVSFLLDRSAQTYAKAAVWLQARRHYDRIVMLDEAQATEAHLWQALIEAGHATVDVLMLVHGLPGQAYGYGGRVVKADFFAGLRSLRAAGQAPFTLRAVYQMNCYGQSLMEEWLSLGAQAVNGSVGVNWLPEPSLSVFLWHWLRGRSFEDAIQRSYATASRLLGLIWRPEAARSGIQQPHAKIASSRMTVAGRAHMPRV